jgi:hypothetical protein
MSGSLETPAVLDTGLPIDVAPVADVHDGNDPTAVVDLLNDPVTANADAPSVAACQLEAAGWSGIFAQTSNGLAGPIIRLGRQGAQPLLGAAQDQDFVIHRRSCSICFTA